MKRRIFTINDRLEIWNSDPNCCGKKICKDQFNRTIKLDEYNKKSKYGWNIDHVIPIARNGSDEIDNLQPLHWKSNLEKDDSPNYSKRV
ncbi:MAG: hypothetical protein HPPSJP_3080 [Candidatus Hepatoplasma scabrum]|nr:MAG: hypothetical protein HPPSJP_3080 [Candidatus Hepatoplasma sp.]